MLNLDLADVEALYQAHLNEYNALEAEAPLTAVMALNLGGEEFERQMCQAVAAGQYPPAWVDRLNQLSAKLTALLVQLGPRPGDPLHNRLLILQDDAEQINPVVVMARRRATVPVIAADTVADALAQGATLCELF